MKDKLAQIIARYNELEALLADPAIISDPERLKDIAREHRQAHAIVPKANQFLSLLEQLDEHNIIIDGDDDELKGLAAAELPELEQELTDLENELKVLLIPQDPNDDKNTIVEIRAGTGGEEAALFAADLFRMYSRFAERNHWSRDIIASNNTGIGGFKEIIFSMKGTAVYGVMKFESGVHRVQRVPKTEAGGRLHTSAATVAVLPEAEDAEINIKEADLKIDTFRASGAGGQHVNKTESAIRITHVPTGLVVICQDEKSQHKNRTAALKVLKSRLLAQEKGRLAKERADARKSMVSTGDRSVKIRTYNFPQGRITDHRINFTSYKLEKVMDGNLNEIIEQLKIADQQVALQAD
ncbi:MAG: peptide chain release factor 1 [Candidatus Neomarinimicrobiota bacterium]|nr:MAG: peptide chain release factor 1 [Candidatus Neomarinimicrobiota bacterium]